MMDPDVTGIDYHLIRWILTQQCGIMKAVNAIHNLPLLKGEEEVPYGRHGDLNPGNILWFQSPSDTRGILVITDFSLASFKSDKDRSNTPANRVAVMPIYRPPECDVEGGTASQAFDIWTLGCVFLEMVCWLMGGNEMREQFENDRISPKIAGFISRTFFKIQAKEDGEGHGIMVKKAVNQV
jgi:serine/threonine protein kinase